MASIQLLSGGKATPYYFFYETPVSVDQYGNQGIYYNGSSIPLGQIFPPPSYTDSRSGQVWQATSSSFIYELTAVTSLGGYSHPYYDNVDNLVYNVTYNGSYAAPAGNPNSSTVVNVVVTMTAPIAASASLSYTIQPAQQQLTTLQINNYVKTYDGLPYDMTAQITTNTTVSPTMSYLGVSGTSYGPSSAPPTNAGKYFVTASFAANQLYSAASKSSYLVIEKISNIKKFSFNTTSSYYTGDQLPLTCSTIPIGLNYIVSYNGSAAAPKNIGSYTVTAQIIDPNVDPTASNQTIVGTYNITKSNQIPSTTANSTTLVRATYSAAINKFLVDFVGTYQ
jgi:hypothetical protein